MFAPRKRRPSGGFTLIELLVVVLIVILVSAIALPTVIPALTSRQVGEAARILQAALAGARDAAIRANAPRGIRLYPDFVLSDVVVSGSGVNQGVLQTGGRLTASRIINIEPAPDITDTTLHGSATFYAAIGINFTAAARWSTGNPPSYPFPVTVPAASRGFYPFPNPNTTAGIAPVDQVLMVVQAVYDRNFYVPPSGPGLPNPPTNWFWNVRIGDKFRFADAGRYYTIVGPMTIPNPENLVNDGPPGTSTLNEHLGPPTGGVDLHPEFLFLVNGIDDSAVDSTTMAPSFPPVAPDGFIDNGADGINADMITPGPNFDAQGRPLIDEIGVNTVGEWIEIETWIGAVEKLRQQPVQVPGGGATDTVPPTLKYAISRRPVPVPGAREVALPGGAVIDLTTWDFPSPERSRLPVDRLNGTVDILLNQSGQVVYNTTYSSPSAFPMDASFYHFWIADRSDVYAPAPTATTFPFLPMPQGAPGYTGTTFLKKDRQLVTLFARSGHVLTNSIETFDATGNFGGASAPFLDAQRGIREAK
jgi:type II secretory pathway pseudopilin PulG